MAEHLTSGRQEFPRKVVLRWLRGPVRGGTHVPCLKFATSYVGISQDSYVTCRNFVSDELCGKFDLVRLKRSYMYNTL